MRDEIVLEPLGHFVSQIFCSAYPVGYNRVDMNLTRPLSVIIQGKIYQALTESFLGLIQFCNSVQNIIHIIWVV